MKSVIFACIFLGAFFFNCSSVSYGQNIVWPQFRGINCSGIAEEKQDPPLQFMKDRNMIWSTPLSSGHSSPCIWNDHIFISGFEKEAMNLKIYCIHRETGDIQWEKVFNIEELGSLHSVSSPATATPATDGERVIFYFGCQGLFCYDFQGNLQWERRMTLPESRHGMGTSPIIVGDLVILNCFGFENDPHLLALNKYNGKMVWKQSTSGNEEGATLLGVTIPPDSYSTPVIHQDQIIIYRSKDLSAYDINSGDQVWRYSTDIPDAVATPVIGNDIVYAAIYSMGGNNSSREQYPDFPTFLDKYDTNHDARIEKEEVKDFVIYLDPDKGIEFGGGTMDQFFFAFDSGNDGFIDSLEWKAIEEMGEMFYQKQGIKAMKLGGKGDITLDQFLWGNKDYVSNIACPLYYNDLLYMVRSGGILSCFNAENGELMYREKLGAGGAYLASPVAVNGRIYCASYNGIITVLEAGKELHILARNDLDEKISATPAVVDDKIYLRTAKAMYAFGN